MTTREKRWSNYSVRKKTCYKIIGTHLWISQTHGNTKKERKNSEIYPCNDCSGGLEYSRDKQISEICWPTSLPNPYVSSSLRYPLSNS